MHISAPPATRSPSAEGKSISRLLSLPLQDLLHSHNGFATVDQLSLPSIIRLITLDSERSPSRSDTIACLCGVAVAASVFTLTAMSVDRWISISPEPRLRPPGRKQALLILAGLWFVALLIFFPLLLVASVRKESVPIISKAYRNISIENKEVHFCTEEWPSMESRKQFGTLSFTLVYAIPGSITILSYVFMGRTLCSVRPPFDIYEGNISMQQGLRLMKERKRVAWILLLLAVLFALCWMPYNIMQLLLDINLVNAKDLSMYLPYALFVGHANSAINPIVYCLMTKNFQRSVHKLLCGRALCQQTKFTWRCTQKPDGSSSDYELYHEPHKRCYLHMTVLRPNGHTHGTPTARGLEMRATSKPRDAIVAPHRACARLVR
ncbi:jg3023 [Pararge aegeria aegeria]|uniref:Jg3023 protein n=1 Tax=Pararge aegeria aegeria TaxID=348720 RepID=A0A8S4QQQ6_9NEOP|nr:jg3023 [Pararge aegeria aegeria]